MLDVLRTHTIVHLRFLKRSRLLLGFVLLIGLGWGVGLVPALFLDTTSNRFEVLKQLAYFLHGTANVVASGIGLFVLATHRRQRNIKMIATKPAPFEAWIASVFLTAAVVGVVAHGFVALLTFGLSRYWGVPYQTGFLFIAVEHLASTLIVLALLTALGAAIHPVIAVLALLFVNESMFKFVGTTIAGAFESGHRSFLISMSKQLFTALYYVVPTFDPFSHEMQSIGESLRPGATEWRYLAAAAAYAGLVVAFGYVMTLVVMRRRPLT